MINQLIVCQFWLCDATLMVNTLSCMNGCLKKKAGSWQFSHAYGVLHFGGNSIICTPYICMHFKTAHRILQSWRATGHRGELREKKSNLYYTWHNHFCNVIFSHMRYGGDSHFFELKRSQRAVNSSGSMLAHYSAASCLFICPAVSCWCSIMFLFSLSCHSSHSTHEIVF